ncbi:hypothetical protein [Polaromonas sp.]|uniref:hypothetical protein n=1 Tax=Polaromonas sp. TaxID=1869339 RepID=UPI0024893F8F|nr:hypothetical protein [Polaromonas sp.]MDI1340873.1 hypothetical protein [Polaromonas sp.]
MKTKRDWADAPNSEAKHPSAWLPLLGHSLDQWQATLTAGKDIKAILMSAGKLTEAEAQKFASEAATLDTPGGRGRRGVADTTGFLDELPGVSVTWYWAGMRISVPYNKISEVNNAVGGAGAVGGFSSLLIKSALEMAKLFPKVLPVGAAAAATPPGAVAAGVAAIVLALLAANLGVIWGLVKAVDKGYGANINISWLALPFVIASAGTLAFTLFVPTALGFWQFQHQVRSPDWAHPSFADDSSHKSEFADLLDHDGNIQRVRASGNTWIYVERATQKEISKTGVLRYQSWDGTKWYARIYGARFFHSQHADFSTGVHESDILNYMNSPTVGYSLRLI